MWPIPYKPEGIEIQTIIFKSKVCSSSPYLSNDMINEVLEPDSDDCAGKGAKVSNNQLVVVSRVADTQQHKELISAN